MCAESRGWGEGTWGKSESASKALRARRKPESLARLKQAARKLFVERGYDATRPQDIAREAGLGHGTFYLHYADKRACFLSFVDDARRELDAHLRDRAPWRQPGRAHRRRPWKRCTTMPTVIRVCCARR